MSPENVEREHQHDGIREYDNPLPNWWLAIFIGTIVFGYGYWMHFHVAGTGQGLIAEYQAAEAEAARRAAATRPLTDEVLLALAKDPQTTASGEKVFAQNCVACHGAQGEGKIGPNLTDEFWIHGGKPTDIFGTVNKGWVDKGMPAWGPSLGAERVRAVVAFVLTRRGLNLPGKEPQGDRFGVQ